MLVMFPGQGSQSIGMSREVLDLFPYTSLIFEAVEDSTSLRIRSLCAEGPEDQLRLSEFQQPSLLAVSVAMWKVLEQEAGISPSLVAGHSLGEYSALVCSGVLDLCEAAKVVRMRGAAMQNAVPAGIGGMSAVIGLDEQSVRAACLQVKSGVVEVANLNAETQIIVSGHKKSLDELSEYLTGVRIIPLPVSAPFHSSLMQPAQDEMSFYIHKMSYQPSRYSMIPNVSGEVVSQYSPDFLEQQITAPVLWYKSMCEAREAGCETFVECGPGQVLSGLAKRMFPRGSIRLVATGSGLRNTLHQLG
ncbi:MAG: ACP S-malonyltransferase [Oligoflexales bacterium]